MEGMVKQLKLGHFINEKCIQVLHVADNFLRELSDVTWILLT